MFRCFGYVSNVKGEKKSQPCVKQLLNLRESPSRKKIFWPVQFINDYIIKHKLLNKNSHLWTQSKIQDWEEVRSARIKSNNFYCVVDKFSSKIQPVKIKPSGHVVILPSFISFSPQFYYSACIQSGFMFSKQNKKN